MALDQTEDIYPYERNMGFFDHIDELRKRLVRVAIVLLIAVIVAFAYVPELFDSIIMAPYRKDFWGYRFLCAAGKLFSDGGLLCFEPPAVDLQSQQIQGQFISAFKISMVVGFIATFPIIIQQVWSFVKPALSVKEIRKTRGSLVVVSLLFFSGVVFAYYLLVPVASSFLLGYSLSPDIKNLITVSSITGFVTFMCLATGLVFELPVLIYVLAKIGFISSGFLKKYWRYAAVVIFIIAGIATPSPDLFSQLLLGLPLLGLYVVGIFIAARVEKNKALEELENNK